MLNNRESNLFITPNINLQKPEIKNTLFETPKNADNEKPKKRPGRPRTRPEKPTPKKRKRDVESTAPIQTRSRSKTTKSNEENKPTNSIPKTVGNIDSNLDLYEIVEDIKKNISAHKENTITVIKRNDEIIPDINNLDKKSFSYIPDIAPSSFIRSREKQLESFKSKSKNDFFFQLDSNVNYNMMSQIKQEPPQPQSQPQSQPLSQPQSQPQSQKPSNNVSVALTYPSSTAQSAKSQNPQNKILNFKDFIMENNKRQVQNQQQMNVNTNPQQQQSTQEQTKNTNR
ncbi:hypothetical protein GPJ56_001445 [Histomonas meleagridis]|uniref:uncharacterized protein n=1 Tax=Histomonas meleagridis TaxID=135588 RepID=UPI00355A14B5|nr:hypothetical protein GPJ56_001445 [Histomonas meleagridis]KAH0798205.1 hypothetical protein GO595_009051 [Histomonas meleagridis]